MTNQQLTIEIERIEHGWAYVSIRHGDQLSSVSVSDLSDGLRRFVAAVEQVAGGDLWSADCVWEHEPSISLVTVRQSGKRMYEVELRISAHDGDLSPIDATGFDWELQTVVDIRVLAQVTLTEFERLLEVYGADGYATRWNYPFPHDRLDALRGHLQHYDRIETENRRLSAMPVVLPEVLCHDRMSSAEIAVAMGVEPDRVVEALRHLEDLGRFRLEVQGDDVVVIPGSIDPDIQRQSLFICRDR